MTFGSLFPNWKPTSEDALKGYEILKSSNRLPLLSEIRFDILTSDFNHKKATTLFFGDEGDNANFICKQYLFNKLINTDLYKAVLASVFRKKSIFYPIPPLWQNILSDHGVQVSRFWCTIAWFFFIISHWGWGLIHFLKTVTFSIITLFGKATAFRKPHSYFFDLNASGLYADASRKQSKTVLSWYISYHGDQELTLFHQVVSRKSDFTINHYTVAYHSLFLSPFTRLADLLKFIIWGIKAVTVAGFNILMGRWLYALLLKESTLLLQITLLDSKLLAKDYLFNNSSSFYRPLWTYGAEKRGAQVLFYFYSIPSFLQITEANSDRGGVENWILLSWSKYFVWNKHQELFVRKFVGDDPEVIIYGPILLSDSSAEIEFVQQKSISVFDIQPYRDDYYKILGLAEEYFIPQIAIQFLQDISTVLSEAGYCMLHKRKRDSGDQIHKDYIQYLNRNDDKHVVSISPETSAIKVIEISNAVISMPFTSTAFLGIMQGKPSVFYDPTGKVCKNNPSANGIEVINGIIELRSWVFSLT
jgi:polysaccharide biosynthesis PFTS motif protein